MHSSGKTSLLLSLVSFPSTASFASCRSYVFMQNGNHQMPCPSVNQINLGGCLFPPLFPSVMH